MKRLYTLALTLLVGFTTLGQELQLTLSEAVQIALENNITLKREQNILLQNQATLQSSRLSMAPNISAGSNAGTQRGNSFNQQEGQVVNGVINFLSGSISVDMPIFNGMSNLNTIRSDKSNFEAQDFNVQRTEQTIISQVAAQYLETLLSQELLSIERENLQLQQTNLEKIENEVTLGAKAEVDKFNQISIVKTAELNVLRAEVVLRNNKTTLSQSMMMDPNIEYVLSSPQLNTALTDIELDQLNLDEQVGNRKDLASLELQELSNKYQYMSTRATFMPSLNAFMNYGSRYNEIVDPAGFPNRTFSQQFFQDNTYINYGLALNIPIFNQLRNRSQYVRNKIVYENSVLQRKELEITAKSEIQRAIRNYKDARLNYEYANAALEAAERSFQLNRESYELGLISLVDLSQSNRDYFQAKSDMIRAELTLSFQDILLKDVMGTLSIDDIAE